MPTLFEPPHFPFEFSASRRTSGRVRPTDDRGDLSRVRRGVYMGRAEWEGMSPDDRYRAFIHATLACSPTAPLLSHFSAAALRRLPVVGSWPDTVHTVVSDRSGGRSSGRYTRHRTTHEPLVEIVDGARCTTLERTIVDVARTGWRATALAMADHALARGWTTSDALLEEDATLGPGRGSQLSRALLALADPGAANGGESFVRLLVHDAGFDAPRLQHRLEDGDGLIGFADFYWPDPGLVLEFDGRRKYSADEFTNGAPAEDIVWREKRREDRIRSLGIRVVRATWEDLHGDSPRVLHLLAAAGAPRRRQIGFEGAR
jgi:hypothetical protein